MPKTLRYRFLILFVLICFPANSACDLNEYDRLRERMVKDQIVARGIEDPQVIRAIATVPRHRFVSSRFKPFAYGDYPLSIGEGQTISQPYIVAFMTEALELTKNDKVLEIGTGSGYQAAILAELGDVDVYTIEIVPELHRRSDEILAELGYQAVQTRQTDGYYGWPEAAPFDAIIVTAAPDHLPGPLEDQLAEGGRMVIPIGPQGFYQTLWKFVKEEGELTAYNMGNVAFVPFTGKPGGVPMPTP